MNGYQMLAESYESLLAKGKVPEEVARPKIRVYNFLATCSKEDFYTMVDSSAFNDIIKSFCKVAMKSAELDAGVSKKVLQELEGLFESRCREVMERS